MYVDETYYNDVFKGEPVESADFPTLCQRAGEIIEKMTLYRLTEEYTEACEECGLCSDGISGCKRRSRDGHGKWNVWSNAWKIFIFWSIFGQWIYGAIYIFTEGRKNSLANRIDLSRR